MNSICLPISRFESHSFLTHFSSIYFMNVVLINFLFWPPFLASFAYYFNLAIYIIVALYTLWLFAAIKFHFDTLARKPRCYSTHQASRLPWTWCYRCPDCQTVTKKTFCATVTPNSDKSRSLMRRRSSRSIWYWVYYKSLSLQKVTVKRV